MLPEWGQFIIWFLATVLAMVLGNYVIKDMGGRIDDAFGVSGDFIPMAIAGFGILSIIGTLLVKITDEMLKKHKAQKALILETGFLLD
jgi:K(+)-stimulated pyrophosphate-energized sodium pump